MHISFQKELVPRPFCHIYCDYRYFLSDEFAEAPTNHLLALIDACKDYKVDFHGTYLLNAGYTSLEEYSNYIE